MLDALVPLAAPIISKLHDYAPIAISHYNRSIPSHADPEASQILDSMSRFWCQDAIFYDDMGAEIDYSPIEGPEGGNMQFLLKTDKIEANNNRHLTEG